MRVRQVCDKYDLPYTTGSLLVQYGKAWRTIAKLSLPNKDRSDPADDAPETRSEKMFAELEPASVGTDPATGRRRGLKTAMATVRQWRRRNGLRRKGFAHSRWASRWTWPYRQIRRNSLGRRRQGGRGWPGRNCAGLVVSERLQDVRSA